MKNNPLTTTWNLWHMNGKDTIIACLIFIISMPVFAVTIPTDTVPDIFTFINISNTELSTSYESNVITISGVNSPTVTNIIGGQYSVNNGEYTSGTSVVHNGDTIRVRLTSAATYATATSGMLIVGSFASTYTITTKSVPGSGGGSTSSGAGGGSQTTLDMCPGGDYSPSRYDNTCGTPPMVSGAVWNITKVGRESVITITTASGTSISVFSIPEIMLSVEETRFRDIGFNWAREYIYKLALRGIVNNSIRYRPNDSLTRAEFLKILINTAGWNIESEKGKDSPFLDVEQFAWYAPYVSLAVSRGIITNTNLLFRPRSPISRAEAMKMIVLVLGVKIDGVERTFLDVSLKSSLLKYIETARSLDIVSGQLIDGRLRFRPSDPITRAEIAKIIARSFGL